MNLGLSQQEISACFTSLDIDNDGIVEFEEFRAAFKPADANYGVDHSLSPMELVLVFHLMP